MNWRDAAQWLSHHFNLAWEGWEQDYPLEVADASRLEEFVSALEVQSLQPEQEKMLMELILSSFDDWLHEHDVDHSAISAMWLRVEKRLKQNWDLHEERVRYWALIDSPGHEGFRLTPFARALWATEKDFYQSYQPEGIYQPSSYVHAMRAGNTIYVAGQVARDANGVLVAPNNAAGQARQVYHNLGWVLEAAGARPEHVVKVTTYLVDGADSKAVAEVRLAFFGDHRPPHTGLIVAGLGSPEVRLEVEVIAVLPD